MYKSQPPIPIREFTDLVAWKEGHKLVLGVYEHTKDFPLTEQFGLTSQVRRAVVSVTSNVAEGFSRKSSKEKVQFYRIALGSLIEVQNQLMIARDVAYLKSETYQGLYTQTVTVRKLLYGLLKTATNYNTS